MVRLLRHLRALSGRNAAHIRVSRRLQAGNQDDGKPIKFTLWYCHGGHHTMIPQNYSQRVHFYYCILVALKINAQSKKPSGVRGKNNFLLKWLRNAQNNTLFAAEITSEIEWLRGKIISSGPDTDLEPMLQYVYDTAKRAETMRLGR